jgi:hypothetical protein
VLTIEALIQLIHKAFGGNRYPGDDYLQGSFEGCEPYDEVGAFRGLDDWTRIDADLLDRHNTALSFFSEAGLRFYLPAYLVAGLRDELQTADPLFHLVHGFSDVVVEHETPDGTFTRRTGRTAFLNPARYGAATWYDHARWRLSVFSREEAGAIVAYLRHRRDSDPYRLQTEQIDAALHLYWLDRAQHAPTAASLAQHQAEEQRYLEAISRDLGFGP